MALEEVADYAIRQPSSVRQDVGGSGFYHGRATDRSYPDIEIRLVTRKRTKAVGTRLGWSGRAATFYFRGGSTGESSA